MMPLTMLVLTAAQTASEAIQPSSPGQITTWIAVAVLTVSSIAGWLRIIFIDGRRAKDEEQKAHDKAQGVPPPGNGLGTLLKDHGERLTKHDAEIKGLCERMAEIRADNISAHDKLFGKIDTLKDQIFEKIDEVRAGK